MMDTMDATGIVGIIFVGDLLYCPYLKKYVEILEKINTKYEVLYWNRSGKEIVNNEHYLHYDKTSKLKKNKLNKIADFYSYRRWLVKILSKRRYDKFIVLSTLSGILLIPELSKMKGKYLFDVRDYSYESFPLFYIAEKRIIKQSGLTVISSKGFENFLPRHTYLYTHNVSIDDHENYKDYSFRKKDKKKINVVWMGALRYFKHQKKIIDHLAEDDRFEVYYHGDGSQKEEYMKYIREHDYKNIHFTGIYNNDEKTKMIKKADVLNNSYGAGYETRYALSNKFYDGAFYHIPQIVETGTYKTGLTEKYGIGIAIDENDINFADKLYDWYMNIEEERFNRGCDTLMKAVFTQLEETNKKIETFLQ